MYPMVPGHEIVGEVIKVGKNVKSFKAGDKVGVGCIVDSCRECEACKKCALFFPPSCMEEQLFKPAP